MQPSKSSFSTLFAMELINEGGIWLPKILIQNYIKMGLTDREMLLVIHLLILKSENNDLIRPEDISCCMEIDEQEVELLINSLAQKGIVDVECGVDIHTGKKVMQLSMEGLYDKLLEIWGCNKAVEYEKKKNVKDTDLEKDADLNLNKSYEVTRIASKIYRCFEKEFGRPLSPIESNQILEWLQGEGYSEELILEALKRAVLRGVINFKYIDSILRGWAKNNLRTAKEISAYEESFSQRHQEKKLKKNMSKLKSKYEDIYIT
ncbi:MAG: DnaD domain protein [Clostridia bacterium]|nr:DnaD domain protein [Clostridia bacterium]